MSKTPKEKFNRAKSNLLDVYESASPRSVPESPKNDKNNLRKFEDLLLTVDADCDLEKIDENPCSARVQLREEVNVHPLKKSKMTSINHQQTQPKAGLLRRRSRNLAKLSIHSVSESSDRMAFSIQQRSAAVPRSPRETEEPKSEIPSQKGLRSMSSMRLGFKNIFNSPGSKREKPEKQVLGKEIYGSVIVEDALVHTDVRLILTTEIMLPFYV